MEPTRVVKREAREQRKTLRKEEAWGWASKAGRNLDSQGEVF